MGEEWAVYRTRGEVTEYWHGEEAWLPDKKHAKRMHEEYAKGTANGLNIHETAKKGRNPYKYNWENIGAQS